MDPTCSATACRVRRPGVGRADVPVSIARSCPRDRCNMGSSGSDCERAIGVGTSARWAGRISRPMLDQAVTRPFSSRWLSTAQPRTVAVSARDNLSCSNLCRCQPMVNVPCARAPAPAIATLGSPPIFDQPASGGEVDAGNQYDQDGDGHERRCSRAASPNPCSKIIGWQNFLKSVPPARPATGRSARSSPITTASPYTVLGSDIGSFSVVDSVPTIACHILVNGQLALCDWAFTEGRYGAVLRGAHHP